MKLGDREVGKNNKPFIIAEMSGNHQQSLEKALKLVDIAYSCGVDALKIQTYTPDTMTLNLPDDPEFIISDQNSLWHGMSFYELYRNAYTPWEWHKPIFDKAKEKGIIAFSTPFDETSFSFLEDLEVPFYKISSFENTDIPLIKKIAATGKPIIISTGMANLSELDDSIREAKKAGCTDILLMKCTSNYPSSPENSNLFTIPHMRELFNCEVGLSDHTKGIGAAVASVALGATVIEKHFTFSRKENSVDAAFSLEPHELKSLVVETERAWLSLGKIKYGPTLSEKNPRLRRRSLYVTKNLKKGEILTKRNIRAIRPGHGLPPKYFETILGKKVSRDVTIGTPLSWDLIG